MRRECSCKAKKSSSQASKWNIFEDDDIRSLSEASFRNATDTLSFLQPFFFTVNEATENIVSSEEPTVTDEDLGGDGVLEPLRNHLRS